MAVITPDRFIRAMKKNPTILKSILRDVTQEEAQQARDDGPDGWNVIEIVCHLHDFDIIFMDRACAMVETEMPKAPIVDHEALAVENRYAEQQLDAVLTEYLTHREAFNTWMASLSEADWQRRGIHPDYGEITVLDQIVQAAEHDINHYEQIARILGHDG